MTHLFLVQGSHPSLGRRPFFFFSLRVPTLLLAGRPFLLRIAPRATPTPFLAGRSFFLLDLHCAVRHARPHARTLASAHTDDRRTDERRDVRSAGVAAWLAGSLHDAGEYGAYAHRCGGPLSLRPLSPCPYNAAVPKGPAFSFLNYYRHLGLCNVMYSPKCL